MSTAVRVLARCLIAVVSAAVLALSGVAWVQLHPLDRSASAAAVTTATPPPGAPAREQNILLVGLDTRTDARGDPLPPEQLAALHAGAGSDGGDNTDTMIVVHLPAGGGAATAFSIPRDSYVALAGCFGSRRSACSW